MLMCNQLWTFAFLISFLVINQASAQIASWGGSVDYSQGTTLRHRADMVFDLSSPARAINVELLRQTDGRRYMEELFRHPRWGVGGTWLNYGGRRDELGYAWGLYGYFELALLRKGWFSAWGRMNAGFAYIDRIFDRDSNPINNAIGSYVNNYTSFAVLTEARLHTRWSIRLGGEFAHQSNARRHMPNLGLNTARLRSGLVYRWRMDSPAEAFDVESIPFDRRVHLYARLGFGLTERKVPNGPSYPLYVASVYVSRRMTRTGKFLMGFEYAYDVGERAFMFDQDIPLGHSGFQPHRPSWILGYELGCGHFGMMGQFLIHLHRLPQGRWSGWGTKFGPNLYLRNQDQRPPFNVFVGMYLKNDLFVASYFETTVGVVF